MLPAWQPAACTSRQARCTGLVSPMPEPPPGVLVREGAHDDAVRRAAHRVSMAAFAEHFGHADTSYEQWLETHEARSVFDWSQLTVVEADGEPVAICECSDAFVGDENCGYVMRIGVMKQSRGRGLAAGQVVLSGALTEAVPVAAGDVIVARFDRLGTIEVACR